jgi:hypothetical protein
MSATVSITVLSAGPVTCVPLTDGSGMCHMYNTNGGRLLTPDINGNYACGTVVEVGEPP